MSNWYGTSRSNYVRVSDEEGLKNFLGLVHLTTHKDGEGRTGFFADENSGNGGWPSFYYTSSPDPDDPECELENEHEFDFAVDIMPFVAEGEVLVIMSAGAEKSRYVTGHACAYIRRGGKVDQTFVNLDLIYAMAANQFGVPEGDISACSY